MILEAQLEAAYTFQAWGGKNDSKYREAIGGLSEKDSKSKRDNKVIWGWAHMSSVLQRSGAKNPGLMHHFHESRFNLNRCRLLRSTAGAPDERKRDLEGAQRDIEIIARLYPDMGGPDWSPLYKKLYSEIRSALNNPGTLECEVAKITKPL